MRANALLLCGLMSLLVGASPAQAEGVALAVSLPDKAAVHRDFAAGVVQSASARFQMITPQLSPSDVSRCQADEGCLLKEARQRAASHLLSVGVAALGEEELAISLRVLEVETGAVVVNLSDLTSPSGDPRAAGRALAARALEGAAGIPARTASSPAEPSHDRAAPVAVAPAYDGLSPLSLAGWSVLGVSGVGVGAAVVGGAVLLSAARQDDDLLYTLAAASAGGVTLGVAAGFGLVVVDGLLLQGE